MKTKRKILIIVLAMLLGIMILTISPSAITEEEVEKAVEESSKEEVTGNILIWFLCAIAFLKISQKIDTFMSGLGINVGNTGGSILAEAMIVARVVKSGKQMMSRSGSHKTSGGANESFKNNTGFFTDGLTGVIGRKFNNSAMSSATNQGGNFISRNAFRNSMEKSGSFANNVISSIAKGRISQVGSITGDTASKAMLSYMGYAGDNEIVSPTYSDVEIGDGKIIGNEVTEGFPEGIQFGMYNTEQYMQPRSGAYETVSTVDGARWYKQYASDTVIKTPHITEDGKVVYNEMIAQKLPPIPQRKDKV